MRRVFFTLCLPLLGCAEQQLEADASCVGARCARDAGLLREDLPTLVMDVETARDAVVETEPDASDPVDRVDASAQTDAGSLADTVPFDALAIPDVVITPDLVDVVEMDLAAPRDVVSVDIPRDTGVRVDTGSSGSCVSGATGSFAARARWTGSGTRATVSYEVNNLPDRARWRVTANSRSIGYTPVFGDPFLGEGGLDLSGTVFMDIELSTAGMGAIRGVTLAIYGRSYSTGASGSFSWMTFDGAGAAPSGSVSNVSPYRWYRVDATSAFRPGNAGVLLRISPGPPSGSLVVHRVEVCFDAS